MSAKINDGLTNQQRYVLRHSEALRAYQRQWGNEHKTSRCAYSAKFRERHPEKILADGREWYATHCLEKRVYASLYQKSHPERAKLRCQRKKANRLLAPVNDLTSQAWWARTDEYRHCCAYCLEPITGANETLEHMTPLSRGGNHTLSNVVPVCKRCNSRKGVKTLLEYLIDTGGRFCTHG